ncbi:MAG: DUF4412 domain-containing protein [Opitutaceae bacterium]
MNTPRFLLVSLLSALCLSASALAQGAPGMGVGSVPGVDPLFLKIFSKYQGFSANTSISVVETGRNTTTTLESGFEFLGGKLRVDMDLSKMKSPDLPAETVMQLQAMGMAQMIILSRPDKGLTYVVYPGLKAYAELPLTGIKPGSSEEAAGKCESTDLGQESAGGHPCAKKKLVFTMDDGKKREMLVWLATDMKDFPIQVQGQEAQAFATILFKNVKLEAPAASRLDPPSGYTLYKNVQQMMQTEMMKKMGGGMPAMPE